MKPLCSGYFPSAHPRALETGMSSVNARLRFIEPQLASPVDQPPEGKHWIHEIKHDGYRFQLVIERRKARVFSRNGYDWSDRYPSIVRAAANLQCKSAIIDGEAIVQNGRGASDFDALQSALRKQPNSIILFTFARRQGPPPGNSPRASGRLEGSHWRAGRARWRTRPFLLFSCMPTSIIWAISPTISTSNPVSAGPITMRSRRLQQVQSNDGAN